MSRFVLLFCAVFTANIFAQDAANGQKVFVSCSQCHGEKGEGKLDLKAPMLSGQHDWYIQTQLQAFKSGERKYKNSANCAQGLSDKDVLDVASFLKVLQ